MNHSINAVKMMVVSMLFPRGGDGQTPFYPDVVQAVGESLCLLFLLFIVDVVVEHHVELIR